MSKLIFGYSERNRGSALTTFSEEAISLAPVAFCTPSDIATDGPTYEYVRCTSDASLTLATSPIATVRCDTLQGLSVEIDDEGASESGDLLPASADDVDADVLPTGAP